MLSVSICWKPEFIFLLKIPVFSNYLILGRFLYLIKMTSWFHFVVVLKMFLRFFFFLEVLGLQENLKEGTVVSHIIFPCPDKYMVFPLSTLLTWRVLFFFFFLTQMNLHWQIIITQSPLFTLGFTLRDVLSMG